MNNLVNEFENPGMAWRGKPFWSWNGKLEEGELIRQIHVMQQMGLGGFFMHSRTGLITEYLGEEWFRLTNLCADEAERLGMEAWLYDEDRWPSGTAGGLVTAHSEYRMKFLRLHQIPAAEFQWCSCWLAAFACQLDGVTFREYVRLTPETPSETISEWTVLAFAVEEMEASSFYNGNTYVDTLSREATDYYITITHERYQEKCGDRLGKSIRGIFTDEPHRGAVMSGFGLPNAGRLWMTPWTEELPARFQKQFGTDILDHLPELFLYMEGKIVALVKWQYMELLQQMFLTSFMKPLYDWCTAHGMRLTGHALHEDSLTCQAAMQGSLMRFYEYQHDPGVDVLSESNRNPLIVKQLSSAARQLGKKWLLSELYGCTGWQMNFRSHKEVGDWQALFGINLRCHHLSWYTMQGEAKRDYPASILHQSAWWKDYHYVESYFARLGVILTQGKPCCDFLVLNPIESLWCQIGIGWAEGLKARYASLQKLERDYSELSNWLLGAQIDFDFGDEEMLSRLASVETQMTASPVLHVGESTYRAVIVPHMTTMRSSTLRLLEEFQQAGGPVIFAGEPPAYLDVILSDAPTKLALNSRMIPWKKISLLEACQEAVKPIGEILDLSTGKAVDDVFCQVRSAGSNQWIVVINRSATSRYDQLQVRLQGKGVIEEWDCRTGERYSVLSQPYEGGVEFTMSLSVSGERVYRLCPNGDSSLSARPVFRGNQSEKIEGPFPFQLGEENVCVLDSPRWQLGGAEWQPEREILQIDQSVRESLQLSIRSGEMVQPWFRKKSQAISEPLAELALKYEIMVEPPLIAPLFLCLEHPEYWKITINGVPLTAESEGWWVDTAFQKIPLPLSDLRAGMNEIKMQIGFREEVDLEAIYLVGNFGVRLNGNLASLTPLPKQVTTGDLTIQGFPFYGGPITYHLPLPAAAQGKKIKLAVSEFEGACVKADSQIIAFPPYQLVLGPQRETLDLEVVLTRRNTFGPLHQVPLRTSSYGPANFTTKGESFSDLFQLYPAGLLQSPIIEWAAK